MDDLVAIIVPLGLFASIAFGVYARYYFLSKTNMEQQDTLRAAIAAGQKLDEDAVAVLVKRPPSPEADLKSGIMLIAFGIGFFLGGVASIALKFEDDIGALLQIVGLIIGTGGLGNLVSFYLRTKLQKQSEKKKIGE